MAASSGHGGTGNAATPGRTLGWAACTLGFSIGGFFDGILLHQVLQWHHLLSGIDTGIFDDIRTQILADGIFHLLMYVIGAAGLVLLWRARRQLSLPDAGRMLVAGGLIGFGAWHIVDSVVSHWITGIHRIRMDSSVPLVWDLIWFAAFGLAPAAIGWMRWPTGRGGRGAPRGRAAAAAMVLALLVAAPVSMRPAADARGSVVLFRSGVGTGEAVSAIASIGGRIVWTDPLGGLWAIDLDDPAEARKLYRRGALLVSNSLLPAGCLDWFDV